MTDKPHIVSPTAGWYVAQAVKYFFAIFPSLLALVALILTITYRWWAAFVLPSVLAATGEVMLKALLLASGVLLYSGCRRHMVS